MAAVKEYAGVTLPEFFDSIEKGIEKNMGEKETIPIAGKPVGKQTLLSQIRAKKKLYDDAEDARVELTRRVKLRDSAEADAQAFAETVDTGIGATWGTDAHVKAKYGVPLPKNRRELTVEEKMQLVALGRATREKRGTLGKREKEKIKALGEVTVTTTLNAPNQGDESADGTQPNGGSPAVAGSAPVNGGTNVVAGAPVASGGAASGGTNVLAGGAVPSGAPGASSSPASTATNVVAPAISSAPQNGAAH